MNPGPSHLPPPSPAPHAAPEAPPSASSEAQAKLDALRRFLRNLGSALVCYSGGIDSALVLAVAHEQLGSRALGITAVSPSLAPRERQEAERFARTIGAAHIFIDSNELQRPGYVQNGPDRCFHCKSELYELTQREMTARGLAHLLNGTNQDDLGDYRPGLEAAKQAGALSPLAELGFSKQNVRAVAQLLDLEIWDKPASACLSSRIPYGTSVTRQRLDQIAGFENDLKELGFRQLRVRFHGKVARLELGGSELPRALEPEIRPLIIESGKRHGFQYVALDLEGYRVGSHNEVLELRSLPVVS